MNFQIASLNKNIKIFFIKENAEYPGARRENIYVYPEKKNLSGHRVGKFGKFKIAEVDAWVHSGEAADRNSL